MSSILTRIEATRAIVRRDPSALETLESRLSELLLLEIDDQIVAAASRLEPPLLRCLDAIHLASALSLGLELGAVVTYDRCFAEAARSIGLRVLP